MPKMQVTLNYLGLPVESLPKLSIKKELLEEDKKVVVIRAVWPINNSLLDVILCQVEPP